VRDQTYHWIVTRRNCTILSQDISRNVLSCYLFIMNNFLLIGILYACGRVCLQFHQVLAVALCRWFGGSIASQFILTVFHHIRVGVSIILFLAWITEESSMTDRQAFIHLLFTVIMKLSAWFLLVYHIWSTANVSVTVLYTRLSLVFLTRIDVNCSQLWLYRVDVKIPCSQWESTMTVFWTPVLVMANLVFYHQIISLSVITINKPNSATQRT